jgi:hypothetical protein
MSDDEKEIYLTLHGFYQDKDGYWYFGDESHFALTLNEALGLCRDGILTYEDL